MFIKYEVGFYKKKKYLSEITCLKKFMILNYFFSSCNNLLILMKQIVMTVCGCRRLVRNIMCCKFDTIL